MRASFPPSDRKTRNGVKSNHRSTLVSTQIDDIMAPTVSKWKICCSSLNSPICSAWIALFGLLNEMRSQCNASHRALVFGGTFASCITFAHSLVVVVCCRKHLPHGLSFRFERPAIMARAKRGEIGGGGEQQEALASPGVVQFTRER